jgi:hypothetical protein
MKPLSTAALREIDSANEDLASSVALRPAARWVVDPETGRPVVRWALVPLIVAAARRPPESP